jgi:glycosyltransferase involved in cell wall biosynthesis
MFVLQAALVRAPGGIETAVAHYERMFRAVGVPSAIMFRGPSADVFRADGVDVMHPPLLISTPWAAHLPFGTELRRDVLTKAKGAPLVVFAHSDLALARLRLLFPDAVTIAPCHSDKTKHKQQADLVITLNPEQQKLAQSALPTSRVKELGNPFVPPADRHGPAHNPQSRGVPRLNFIGRFEGFKDPLTLIRAFSQANLPPVELRLIGAGRLDDEVRQAAAESTRPVTLAGWRKDPFAQFDQDDVLVLPSTWESYSYVIREALDFGVPVIASDIHVHRTALDDGAFGLLFPPGNVGALASTLERALAQVPQLRAMAIRGGEALRARYGAVPFWASLAGEIDDIRATPSCS